MGEHQNVHRYSIGGHLETLPSFMHPMAGHACGSYLNSEGQTVLMVVTQGYGGARISSSRRDRTTVLELRQGADHWTRGPGDSDWSPTGQGWPGTKRQQSGLKAEQWNMEREWQVEKEERQSRIGSGRPESFM